MNKSWHDKNKMPRNPSLKERIAWHTEHAEQCGCRPIPRTVFPHIKKAGRGKKSRAK